MNKVILLILVSTWSSTSLGAPQFKNFKLKGRLFNKVYKTSLLNSDFETKDLDNDSIYQKIFDGISESFQFIGEKLTGNIITLNENLNLGDKNIKGISWQMPFANFSIAVNRQLSPDLFDEKQWIVDDSFTIYIDATTYLARLRDDGEIEISDESLTLYAGITFKRTYRYTHFAESFLKGLISDYSKLFLSFWKMRRADIFNLSAYEILSKEDAMSFSGGGLIPIPISGGFNVKGGVLAKYNKISKIVVQALGSQDGDIGEERMRFSIEKYKGKEAMVDLQLQVDFYNLLKVTLLSYDMTYSYGDSDSTFLSLTGDGVEMVQSNEEYRDELISLLKLKKINLDKLARYETFKEQRVDEIFNSKYSALLWGGENERGSSTVILQNEYESRTFVTHFSRSVKYVERIIDKLAGIIYTRIFETDKYLKQYRQSLTKEVFVEFEVDEKSLDDKDVDIVGNIGSSEKLSIRINAELKSRQKFKKSSRWKKSKIKKMTLAFVDGMTSLDESIRDELEIGELRSPLAISSVMRVDKTGIDFFHDLKSDDVYNEINVLCKGAHKTQFKKKKCKKRLEKKFKKYMNSYIQTGVINAIELEKFIYAYLKKVKVVTSLHFLFGKENVFSSGLIELTNKDGLPFQSYFSSGRFRGLGVIDNFAREHGIVAPAPIFNN